MKKLFFVATILIFSTVPAAVMAGEPIKILLVPGHDNETWGTQYGNVKEADMNLNLATQIYNILKKDKRFEVHITRNKKGYNKEFAAYFTDRVSDITLFKENAKIAMQAKVIDGTFVQKDNTPHNNASNDMAVKLYGFNKWAGENNIDAMIHIHFNDEARPVKWTPGKYKGFAIYMPEMQMANSKESARLATDIFAELDKKYLTSTYDREKGGLVPDQKLIALGANDTLPMGVRSILVEYGYIYEKRFRSSAGRNQAYRDMAKLTTTGIKNYFSPK